MIGRSLPPLEEKRYNPTMPKNRIIPALAVAIVLPLWAWAQGPAPTPPTAPAAPPTEAEKLIDAAIDKLRALKSVVAKILQKVDILGQKFTLEGQYLKAPDYHTYMSLKLSGLSNVTGTLVQVCDGKTMLEYQNILSAENCRKYGITNLVKKLESPECPPELREGVFTQLGLAGPDVLLVGLRKSVEFDQKAEGTLDGKPVWILRGRWKDRDRVNLPGQPKLAPTGPLPPYVPSLVTVWLGKEDGWPYQVLLEGRALSVLEKAREERQIGPDGRPTGRALSIKDEEPSRVLLIYSDVEFDAELAHDRFAFEPPSRVRVEDGTRQLEENLDSALAQAAQKKKQDAAKATEGSGLELPQVPVPKPAADAPALAPAKEKSK
jgi:outer membrane lipoprotein-sorting protein